MSNYAVCTVPNEVLERVKQFRFSKNKSTHALILKIDREQMQVMVDEELDDCILEEVIEDIPVHQPRFLLISFESKKPDGRVTYPMCLVFYSPPGCSVELTMLYAGSRNNLVQACELSKSVEVRELEEITLDYLDSKCS